MRTQITTAIAMLFTVAGMTTSAQAQSQTHNLPAQAIQPTQAPVQAPAQVTTQQATQAYVAPGYLPPPPVAPPQQNQFYFGVNVQLNRGYQGTSLRISSVTPGSPASAAGLEVGDEIQSINGRSFERARDSFHAVTMMNRFVNFSSPAAPAAAASAGAQAYVMPQPAPSQPTAQLMVRNVRNGQYVSITMYPQLRGWSGPAPAAAATATVTSAPPAYTPAPAAPVYSVPAPVYSVPAPVYSVPAPAYSVPNQ